jgi:hypothetical protein
MPRLPGRKPDARPFSKSPNSKENPAERLRRRRVIKDFMKQMTDSISLPEYKRDRLPNRRSSIAFVFEFESHRYRASASWFDDGRIGEIFLDTQKPDTPLQLHASTAAILTSLLLQSGVPAETIQHSVSGPIRIALEHFSGMVVAK